MKSFDPKRFVGATISLGVSWQLGMVMESKGRHYLRAAALRRGVRMFDYRSVAKRAGISEQDLARLCQVIREDFPDDEMMFELHVLRAILAIERGQITLEQALKSNAGAA